MELVVMVELVELVQEVMVEDMEGEEWEEEAMEGEDLHLVGLCQVVVAKLTDSYLVLEG